MTATTRKWLGIIGSGVALLAIVLWLTSRSTTKPTAPQPKPPVAVVKSPTPPAVEKAPPAASHPSVPSTVPTPAVAVAQPAIPSAPPAAAPVLQPAITAKAVATATPSTPAQTPPAATPAASPTVPETQGTLRMYAAHAPLRAPAVADPDSGQNRQILQTMVAKALARANEPQATSSK